MASDGDGSCLLFVHDVCYGKNNYTDIYYNGTIIPARSCTIDTCSLQIANFTYLPNLGGNYFFLALFAILAVVALPLGIIRRVWGITVGLFIGFALEAAGYGGRIWGHSQPFAFNPFLLYLIFLTIAPAFLTAAIYLSLARIVAVYGSANSRVRPQWLSIGFMVSDFVALVLQGAGGGIAATGSGKDLHQAQMGINIMIAGLVWQVVSLLLFGAYGLDFALRVRRGVAPMDPQFADLRRTGKWKGYLVAIGIATFCIFTRSAYRVAELSDGFQGKIITEEIPYMIFEGSAIAIGSLALIAFHPSFVFGRRWTEVNYKGKAINHAAQQPYKQEAGSDNSAAFAMTNRH